ncbi:NADH-quinone oxidoreductase subunit D-related protein [Entomobacter blattae]|uniref:NADH-quinone oxidoreductase subunit C/D n=1 Tax=Entomobacter blattae TaxID=2762277 RepID=A0A7H1NUZ7_9PROT|nr:hypothetical protein [Entomobacter blattae]QNT79607.1 NADH-quinone oxidoreductase subunit C/D [Entomobacter blattae]
MGEWEKELLSMYLGQEGQHAPNGQLTAIDFVKSCSQRASGRVYYSYEEDFFSHYELNEAQWLEFVDKLAIDTLFFSGLWSDGRQLFTLFLEHGYKPCVVSTDIEGNRFRSLSTARANALIYERLLYDLWGIEGLSGEELTSFVDHNCWKQTHPLKTSSVMVESVFRPVFPKLNKVLSPSLAIMEKGPAIGEMQGPYSTHMVCSYGKVLAAHIQPGYGHRGIASRIVGASIGKSLKVVSRIAASSSVASQLAFVTAVEASQGVRLGERVVLLRVILLELERIRSHLSVLKAVFTQLDVSLLAGYCEKIMENIFRLSAVLTGHRFMMDSIHPLGVKFDIREDPLFHLEEEVKNIRIQAGILKDSYYQSIGVRKALKGKGVIPFSFAIALNLDGCNGRASGRDLDLRRHQLGYSLEWLKPISYREGCVETRVKIRLMELLNACTIIENVVGLLKTDEPELFEMTMPTIAVTAQAEGIGFAEGAYGGVWCWLSIKEEKVENLIWSDPSLLFPQLAEKILEKESCHEASMLLASLGYALSALDM